jgi:hypothetical protein
VEATKFTEVGFHGKDVDQIIKDLVDIAIAMTKKKHGEKQKLKVQKLVEDRIITELIGINSVKKKNLCIILSVFNFHVCLHGSFFLFFLQIYISSFSFSISTTRVVSSQVSSFSSSSLPGSSLLYLTAL